MTSRIYDRNAVATHFSRAANTYDAHAALQHGYHYKALDWLAQTLPPSSRILDAGCGTGAFARLTAKTQPHWQIVGGDIAPAMCEMAKQYQTATFLCDLQQWPIAPHQFDATLCAFALQWSNVPAEVITNLAQSLKPGAALLLYSFTEGTLRELREATRYAGVEHIVSQFHPPEYYENWALNAGLEMVQFAEDAHAEYFRNAEALFEHLKCMGASNSLADRSKGLASKRDIEKISEAYAEHFTHKQGIKVTWKVVSLIARAP